MFGGHPLVTKDEARPSAYPQIGFAKKQAFVLSIRGDERLLVQFDYSDSASLL